MQKVITVSEESHGFLCVAKDFQSAVDFLINDYWITAGTQIYNDVEHEWMCLDELYGEDWKNAIKSMNEKKFEDTFTDVFYLDEVEVYGA